MALLAAGIMNSLADTRIARGDPEGWERALDDLGDALVRAGGLPERDHDALLTDPDVLSAIRNDLPGPHDPFISDYSIARATGADQWLMDHNYPLAPESRAAFLDALAPRYADALALLIRRARGDFGRDPVADTFPTLDTTKAEPAVSIRALFDDWIEKKKPARGTIKRWLGVIEAAQAHWPDLRRVTETNAREWFKSLVTADRSVHTVNQTWRTALKTLCSWAVREGHLKRNPFAGGKLDAPRKIITRESKAFTDDEAHTILRAALEVTTANLPVDAAKRWLPWVCAYSGARAGEIAQLRGQDISERNGTWAMTLTPEAGAIKDRKPRTVPLHEHLTAQGFLEFVKSRGKGPLFFDAPAKEGKANWQKHPPSAHIVRTVGYWTRALGITDREVSPNRAWRHTFKLNAERAGIPERLSDVITGHAPASIGRSYGQPTLADLAREIKKFPRYAT